MPTDDRMRLDELLATPSVELGPSERTELAALDQRYRVDQLTGAARRNYRRNCQMVFQDAFASLNPRHLVRDIVGRPLSVYKEARGRELTNRVVELLEAVGLGRQHLNRYPHEFSGGQQQRISIARALALDPQVIVLDEPTSALDVSVQAQILNLLHELQIARNLTYVFVSHDLGVIQHISDRILVMYLGEVAEDGPTSTSSPLRSTRTRRRSSTRTRRWSTPTARSRAWRDRYRTRPSRPRAAASTPAARW